MYILYILYILWCAFDVVCVSSVALVVVLFRLVNICIISPNGVRVRPNLFPLAHIRLISTAHHHHWSRPLVSATGYHHSLRYHHW